MDPIEQQINKKLKEEIDENWRAMTEKMEKRIAVLADGMAKRNEENIRLKEQNKKLLKENCAVKRKMERIECYIPEAEFKEAFSMIDQNHDGFIDEHDLEKMFALLDKEISDQFIEEMMNEATGAINFTMFLTLFAKKLNGIDPEDVIKNAFQCFDEDNSGTIAEERLRELLTTMGDRYTDKQVDEFFRDGPIKNGRFDYIEFTRMLKHVTKEKNEEKNGVQITKAISSQLL